MSLMKITFTDASLNALGEIQLKFRKQIIKKARALQQHPFPQGAKKLQGVTTAEGDPIYRERSGDYRILYIVRSNPAEVVVLDIAHRREVYRNPSTATSTASNHRVQGADQNKPPHDASGELDGNWYGEGGARQTKRIGLAAYPRQPRT